jgi:hypothetical protein
MESCPNRIGSKFGHIYHLVIAFILAFPLGWDREQRHKSAGLRTFPLVPLGSWIVRLYADRHSGAGFHRCRSAGDLRHFNRHRMYWRRRHSQRWGNGRRNGNRGEYLEYGSDRHCCGLGSIRNCLAVECVEFSYLSLYAAFKKEDKRPFLTTTGYQTFSKHVQVPSHTSRDRNQVPLPREIFSVILDLGPA